jgi:hypothetical protein
MTIRTAILADGPVIYWPLDDLGATAADASGHGRNGQYIGLVNQHQQGPETGSFSVLLGNNGGALESAGSSVTTVPMTLEIWVAPVIQEPTSQVVVYNGLSNARGAGFTWQPNLPVNGVGELRGGVLTGGTNGPLSFGVWHQLALTYDVSSNVRVYYDGVVVAGPLVHTWNANLAGDPFLVGGPGNGLWYAAHAALFNVALSTAQLAAHVSGRVGPVNPPLVTFPTAADITLQLAPILQYISKIFQNAP